MNSKVIADWTWLSYPSDKEIEAVEKEMKSGDAAQIDQGVQQIRAWLDGHQVIWRQWSDWNDYLMKAHRYPDVAEMALLAVNSRPEQGMIAPLLEGRVKALLAMNKPQEALVAAKSYYNACDWKQTERAVQLLGVCLSQCNPGDIDIASRFRHEQSMASVEGAKGSGAKLPSQSAILKPIAVGTELYADGISVWSGQMQTLRERMNYANLLLAADRADDAETVFRDLYERATTPEQVNAGFEGIARALRAEDGNVARANAWLASNSRGH